MTAETEQDTRLAEYYSYKNKIRLAYIILAILLAAMSALGYAVNDTASLVIWKLLRLGAVALYLGLTFAVWKISAAYLGRGICLARALFTLSGIGLLIFIIKPLPSLSFPIGEKRGAVRNFFYTGCAFFLCLLFAAFVLMKPMIHVEGWESRMRASYGLYGPQAQTITRCMISRTVSETANSLSNANNTFYLTYRFITEERLAAALKEEAAQCRRFYPDGEFDDAQWQDFLRSFQQDVLHYAQ